MGCAQLLCHSARTASLEWDRTDFSVPFLRAVNSWVAIRTRFFVTDALKPRFEAVYWYLIDRPAFISIFECENADIPFL